MKGYKIVLFGILIFLFLLEDSVLLYNRFQANRTILGLKINNLGVSGMTKDQLTQFIKNKLDANLSLKLSYKGHIHTIYKEDINAVIDYQKTLDQFVNEGKEGNFISNIVSQNKAFFGFDNLSIKGRVSKPLLTVKVLDIADQVNQPPQPPSPNFSGDFSQTIPSKSGVKVNITKLTQIIIGNIFTPPQNPIEIPTQTVVKHYNANNLDLIRKQAEEYITEPISISSGGIPFTLTHQDLKSLLIVNEQIDSTNPKKSILALALDHKKLAQKLDSFAKKVESLTASEFNHHDTFAAIYGQFYTDTRRVVDIPIGTKRAQQVLGASTGPKAVYLTFDDGPNIVYHPILLDILKEKGVKATFYLVGSNSKLYKSTTERTIKDGHEIADHSLTHAFLPKLLPNQIYDEMKSTKDILNSFLTDKKITLFRPPYGGINNYVYEYARSLGLAVNYWTVDTRDWTEPSTDVLVQRATSNIKNNDIILLHSNHFATVKALPLIIDKLRAQGFELKTQQ